MRADEDDAGIIGEILLPAQNEMEEDAVCRLISVLPENVSLEYWGKAGGRSLLIRGRRSDVKSAAGSILASCPAANLHFLEKDPLSAIKESGFQLSADYGFSAEGYLPLKRFSSYRDCDPVHAVLSGLLELGEDDAALIRIRLCGRRVPLWLDPVLRRLKAEKQRGFVTSAAPDESGGAYASVPQNNAVDLKRAFLSVLILICWSFFVLLMLLKMPKGAPAFLTAALLLTFVRARMRSSTADPWYLTDLDTLRMKTGSQKAFNLVRLRVITASESQERCVELQDQFSLILGGYGMPGGNALVRGELRKGVTEDPAAPVLEMCDWELASLWHIPWISDTLSPGLIPVRGVEMRCPDASEVAGSCRIGSFVRPNGDTGGVYLNPEMMKHNMFLIGKPGTGKTSLMEHIARAAFGDREEDAAVIVIDPHGDMYSRLSGCIPEERIGDVVLLDFGDPEYVLPYNPLDVQRSGLSPEQATRMIVDVGKSLWTTSWGPRMQIPLQRSVLSIAAHNRSLPPASGADGLSLMGVLLNAREDARRDYIREIEDEHIRNMLLRYFVYDFDRYKEYLQQQVILPVLSKSYRFEESPMLEFFSSPRSVLDPKDIIAKGKILLVNTRMSELGSETSDFLGSFIISLILKEISRQGELESCKRIPVLLLIDEFQTYSGVPWQELLAQLRKWGGRTVLGTQSFASMVSEDTRELPGIIMSGVYSLFSFTVNGEDADYLSRNEFSEKFGGPSRNTLISLDRFTCYARIMGPDGRLTRPFFFRTADPVIPDQDVSRKVFGRRGSYSRKKTEAVSEALEYLKRIEKYRFYNPLRSESAASETPLPVTPGLFPCKTKASGIREPGKGNIADPGQVSEREEIPGHGVNDAEREKMLEKKYGDLLPL